MKCRMLSIVALVSLAAPAMAAAQGSGVGVSVQAGAGTHLRDGGHDLSAAIGFAPTSRIEFLVGAERSHVPMTGGPTSVTRGGTADFISGEIRIAPFSAVRVTPYLVAGVGRGEARPNVNDRFPDPVTNDIWVLTGGAGVRIAVTDHLSVFADVRAAAMTERDTLGLRIPARAGLAWRF
jgi:opacity protein-like surface antigen